MNRPADQGGPASETGGFVVTDGYPEAAIPHLRVRLENGLRAGRRQYRGKALTTGFTLMAGVR